MAAPGHPSAPGYFPSFSTVNFYAGNQLSRFSWLRNDSRFLNAALTSDKTRFIILQHLNPLVHTSSGDKHGTLATLSWKEVEPTIRESMSRSHGGRQSASSGGAGSPLDVFGPNANQIPSPDKSADDEQLKKAAKVTEGLVPTSLAIVFLGVDEADLQQASMPGDMASTAASDENSNVPAGTPYFALSVSYKPASMTSSAAESAQQEWPVERLERELLRDGQYDFIDTRTLAQAGTWKLHDAAVVAQARSLIDWNERHQVGETSQGSIAGST